MSDLATKVCTRCGVDKPRGCFSVDRALREGLKSWCKDCCREHISKDREAHRARVRKNYRDNPEAQKERHRKWRAKNRERDNETARKWRAENPEAALKASRKYRAAHRELCLARTNSWAKRNPERVRITDKNKNHNRRARKRGGMTGPELRQWERAQRKVCHWCGVKCPTAYSIDHVQPLSKGGKHEASNLVIACRPCNSRKHDRDPFEFAQSLGRLL